MKVKELIKKLQKFDPNTEIVTDSGDYTIDQYKNNVIIYDAESMLEIEPGIFRKISYLRDDYVEQHQNQIKNVVIIE